MAQIFFFDFEDYYKIKGILIDYNFGNYFSIFLSILILYTGGNFPGVMLKGLQQSKVSILYFVFFTFFITMILNSFVLTIFSINYQKIYDESKN